MAATDVVKRVEDDPCPACNGTGKKMIHARMDGKHQYVSCSKCRGSGLHSYWR